MTPVDSTKKWLEQPALPAPTREQTSGWEPTQSGVTQSDGGPPAMIRPGPPEPSFATEALSATPPRSQRAGAETMRRFRLTIVEGSEIGTCRESTSDRCSIGSHPLNDLVIAEQSVSRFHCEIRIAPEGAMVVDLKSRNGTVVDGVRIREAFLRGGSMVRLGRVVLRFEFGTQRNTITVSQRQRFGALVGGSIAMRATYALMERAAASNVTVLIEGETGTGKGKAAEAIHNESTRAKKPFVVIDCSAIHGNLLESELFGHEVGAFTGARARRIGAFEEASGGTVFLDEVGELPADLQPKLLRALENREIRRIGANRFLPVDVRVIAATNRDLRAEVNAGRFRSDMYFRLAVLKIAMPPLRAHLQDIPVMVEEMLESLGADEQARQRLLSPEFLADLARGQWPGNARELRNAIERCFVVQDTNIPHELDSEHMTEVLPFTEAKRQAQATFERTYLETLMRRCDGRVARAAEVAGVDRGYLYRLMRQHGMKPKA